MGAVWFRAAVEIRRSWRGSVVLVVLTGVGGGLVFATFAGARRADSVLDRFVAGTGQQFDATIDLGPGEDTRPIARLPYVTRVATMTIVFLRPPVVKSSRLVRADSIASVVLDDPSRPFLHGAIVVSGRVPDPHVADEVAIDEVAARGRGWRVGDRLQFGVPSPDDAFGGSGTADAPPDEPSVALRVTGIVRLPQDLEPVGAGIEQAAYRPPDDLWLTPAFLKAHANTANFAVAAIWLDRGPADLKAFTEAVRSRSGGHTHVNAAQFDAADVIADSERAIHVQANALRAAAALAIVAVLFVAGLALSRQIRVEDREWSTLRTLGMTDRQHVGVGIVRGIVIGLAAAFVALLTAVVVSSRFPVGFARRAEPAPGLRLDTAIFATAALAIVATCVAWSAFAAWRAAVSASALPESNTRVSSGNVSRLGRAVATVGAPVSAVVGVGMALDSRRGRDGVPVRAALATMTVVVAAVAAAIMFATSLSHLVVTPALQGWRWDVLATGDTAHRTVEKLAADPTAPVPADAVLAPLQIDGHDVAALAFRPIAGDGFAQITDGRYPALSRRSRARLENHAIAESVDP